MSHNLLQGKKGIIFGALDEQSIAWKTAESVCAQGGQIVLTNAPVALRMGTINALAEKLDAPVIAADATKLEDLENLIDQAMEHFGGKSILYCTPLVCLLMFVKENITPT